MGSLPNPPERDHAEGEDPAPSLPPHNEEPELLDLDKALEEFFKISRNASGQPDPGKALAELLEKIDYKTALEEFGCPEDPPCTDLLANPVGVLSDEKRWPKHLCPAFWATSTMNWASSFVRPTTPELEQWLWEWPLPIGKMAIKPEILSLELYNLMPFDGQEEALWAIRINDADGTLDLFGLGIPYGQGEESIYEMGELGHDSKRHGRIPLDLVERADRWWAQFRGESIRGRRYGTRRWASLDEVKKDVRSAVRDLSLQGHKITQERVAEHLHTSVRQLDRARKRHGIASWKDFLKTL